MVAAAAVTLARHVSTPAPGFAQASASSFVTASLR